MEVFFISSSTFFWPHFPSFNDNSYTNGIYEVAKALFFSMKNYFWRKCQSSIFCLLNHIHSENIIYSAEDLLPKHFFSPNWLCGYDNIMHHSNLISVTFWIMAVSKVETGE